MIPIAELVRESNFIEGIVRDPTVAEIEEHQRFVSLDVVTIDELIRFVKVYQPDARLRDRVGMNVRVGSYVAPYGGPYLRELLMDHIFNVRDYPFNYWHHHIAYERIHPFTDCNGRSGRALWWWAVEHSCMGANLSFLHSFYYQTLSNT
jgi:hypothetical protein